MGIPLWKKGFIAKLAELGFAVTGEFTGTAFGLYIDVNSVIHKATQYLEIDGLDEETTQNCCELIIYLVVQIVNHYKPKGMVYLAVDGVVPMTKIQQQRERRYESAMVSPKDAYTGSFITPGTLFMERLDKHFKKLVHEKGIFDMHVDNIIYSSYLVPGEGEHKIMDYLRSKTFQVEQGAHIIYGNDADLVLLALGYDGAALYVADNTVPLKSNRVLVTEYLLETRKREAEINIDTIRRALQSILATEIVEDFVKKHLRVGKKPVDLRDILEPELGSDKARRFIDKYADSAVRQTPDTVEAATVELVKLYGNVYIRDFIFLCTLMGNDFLPRSPVLSCVTEDIPFIFDLIVKEQGILRNGLMKNAPGLFKRIADRETFSISTPVSLGNLREKSLDKVVYKGKKVDRAEESFYKFPSPIMRAIVDPSDTNNDAIFRTLWYNKCFRANPNKRHLHVLAGMCTSYIRGMYWVYNYYIYGQERVTWLWYYPYHYAPLFIDLYKTVIGSRHIRKYSRLYNVDPLKDENRYEIPHQLISVMPWQVSRYVPEDLRVRMYSSRSPLQYMLPLAVIVDTEFAEVKHQSKVLVPNAEFYEVMFKLSKMHFKPIFLRTFEGGIHQNMEAPRKEDRDRRSSLFKERREAGRGRGVNTKPGEDTRRPFNKSLPPFNRGGSWQEPKSAPVYGRDIKKIEDVKKPKVSGVSVPTIKRPTFGSTVIRKEEVTKQPVLDSSSTKGSNALSLNDIMLSASAASSSSAANKSTRQILGAGSKK